MKIINSSKIEEKVEKAVIKANKELPKINLELLKKAIKKENNTLAKKILKILQENSQIAKSKRIPLCQDTGIAVFFVKIGDKVKIKGATLNEAITNGVRKGYKKGYLRKSILNSPIIRKNTKDNTPPIIHYELVKGEKFEIDLLIKGGGCENKSALKMLVPADGKKGIMNFVIETVKNAGASACPPYFIGVGIGGNFEKCAILSKKALLRKPGTFNRKKHIREIELELYNRLNKLNIGPAGVGGKTTVFSVAIEEAPCHIASLPVAVNIDCHNHRHIKIKL